MVFGCQLRFIPEHLKFESDFYSRSFNENTEWTLPQSIFDKLAVVYKNAGPIKMDLYASRMNYKVKPYMSWSLDPYCCHVDAFTVPWSAEFVYYAYCPFILMHRLVHKISTEGATVLTVFPLWLTQIWFN